MGLFNFGKKKQEEKKKTIEAKYAAMTIKELETLITERWKVAPDEFQPLCGAYGRKVLMASKSEGGFELSENTAEYIYDFDCEKWIKEYGILCKYDSSGKITKVNKKLAFAGNFLRQNPIRIMRHSLELLFENENFECLLDEEFLDENHQIYNPWVYSEGAEKLNVDQFISSKISAAILLANPDELEKYGFYRKKNGVVTNEFIQIEDCLDIVTADQLQAFFDYHRTRF